MSRVALTYAEYAALPDDGRRYELHDGDLSLMPSPTTRHQRVVGALHVALRQHVIAARLGEVFVAPLDVILSNITVLQPDLVFVDTARAAIVTERGIEGAPTLAVEVLSPSSVAIDRGVKMRLYGEAGVPFVWLVDTEARTVEAFSLESGRYRLIERLTAATAATLPPFPELRIATEALWPQSH